MQCSSISPAFQYKRSVLSTETVGWWLISFFTFLQNSEPLERATKDLSIVVTYFERTPARGIEEEKAGACLDGGVSDSPAPSPM